MSFNLHGIASAILITTAPVLLLLPESTRQKEQREQNDEIDEYTFNISWHNVRFS